MSEVKVHGDQFGYIRRSPESGRFLSSTATPETAVNTEVTTWCYIPYNYKHQGKSGLLLIAA